MELRIRLAIEQSAGHQVQLRAVDLEQGCIDTTQTQLVRPLTVIGHRYIRHLDSERSVRVVGKGIDNIRKRDRRTHCRTQCHQIYI